VSSYRLVVHGYGGRGPLTLSPIYDDLEMARAISEGMFTALEAYPGKRPFRIEIFDVWTRETVSNVYPPESDPFA